MMGPYGIIAGGVALIAALGGAYAGGRRDGAAIVRGGELKAAVAEQQLADAKQDAIDASAGLFQGAEQTRQQGVREIYPDTRTITERPIYSDRCIDPDGVRALDRAAAIANVADQPPAAGGTGPRCPRCSGRTRAQRDGRCSIASSSSTTSPAASAPR